jgi:4-azaleucine resistance transporter AzlC
MEVVRTMDGVCAYEARERKPNGLRFGLHPRRCVRGQCATETSETNGGDGDDGDDRGHRCGVVGRVDVGRRASRAGHPRIGGGRGGSRHQECRRLEACRDALIRETAIETKGYRHGARAVAPLAVAVAGFGISFGVLTRTAGFGWIAPIVMSATTFAGSAQFAAASIIGDGGSVGAAVTAALLLNARYGPIGVSVAPYLTGSTWSRLVRAQLVVDESWAIAAEGDGRFDPRVLVGAGAVLYASWVIGTAVGTLAGDALGDPATLGLDAAFPALFLALLVPQLRGRTPLTAALIGAMIALVLTPIAPAGVPIIAAAAACLLGLRR